MDQKYFLSEEDVMNLPIEQKNEYNDFWRTIYDKGIVYEVKLQKFNNILEQQYQSAILFNPNGLERYPEILSKNISSIIDEITNVRNNIINGKLFFEQFDFKRIYEGLDVLKKFVETKLQSSHYQNSIGYQDLKSLLPRIDKLKTQISQDMNYYQSYYEEKNSARYDYEMKKEAYDKLSLFGKFSARITGRKKILSAVQQKNNYYNSEYLSSGSQQFGDIVNPYQYDEYLKKQQSDQLAGGKKK